VSGIVEDGTASGNSARAVTTGLRRVRARVEGVVQGVGFRPFVHRLVSELDLGGFVLNDERGVLLEVEGRAEAVEGFLARLPAEIPPLARIERLAVGELAPAGEREFAIVHSESHGAPSALVSPDTTTCEDCLAELFDPSDRRHRYPFINCTNCGPRFTIVRGVPYDRPRTTMAGFVMCPTCRAEYEDPADRRFHAQPNACPACGPSVHLTDADGRELATRDEALRGAAAALVDGRIVAVKGLGGFHLACRADDEAAVAELRGRKHREDKPFALMVPDLVAVRGLVRAEAGEEVLLTSIERPIVLARRRPGAAVADAVAPRSAELGVMLPYTPLHHLLLADVGTPIVLTSGNVSDEPIAYRDEDALERLGPIADRFLFHDRQIHVRTDDSVTRVVDWGGERVPVVLRRSRGYVPSPLRIPIPAEPPVLAVGAELKNTFCVAKGERAWVGHHIGDLKNWETLHSFREGIEHFENLFAVEPRVVAHDLHPDYLSTAYVDQRPGLERVGVQHHHAHLAACLAEHGQTGPAVGVILDGSGYGPDGTVWGGELLVGDLADFERRGHLWPVRLPGGDRAVEEPWRMACAWLVAAGEEEPAMPAAAAGRVDPGRWRAVAGLARSGFSSPVTTSAGRLFDAVSALSGVRLETRYEGQAAIELEAASNPAADGTYPLPVVERDGMLVLDPRETIRAVARDAARGIAVGAIGGRFHRALAGAVVAAAEILAQRTGGLTVVLSGGVFQNRLLLESVARGLEATGLRPLVPRRLPANDGGISYGQAAVAAARARSGRGAA